MFYFLVWSADGLSVAVTAGCAVPKLLAKVEAEGGLISREHHLLELARHQGYRVEQGLVAVDAAAHGLRLLHLQWNLQLLVEYRLVLPSLSEIAAFRIIIKLVTFLVGIILSEHVVDYLIVVFVPGMVL